MWGCPSFCGSHILPSGPSTGDAQWCCIRKHHTTPPPPPPPARAATSGSGFCSGDHSKSLRPCLPESPGMVPGRSDSIFTPPFSHSSPPPLPTNLKPVNPTNSRLSREIHAVLAGGVLVAVDCGWKWRSAVLLPLPCEAQLLSFRRGLAAVNNYNFTLLWPIASNADRSFVLGRQRSFCSHPTGC